MDDGNVLSMSQRMFESIHVLKGTLLAENTNYDQLIALKSSSINGYLFCIAL